MQSPVQTYLDRVQQGLADNLGGSTESANRVLDAADPMLFGLALTTTDGFTYASGDDTAEFSIQSISKVFGYALALQDRGFAYLDERIDVEPSGDPFNEISLDATTGKPKNPLINAGAIAASAQILNRGDAEPFDRLLAVCSAAAGRELRVDEDVYQSDKDTGQRNRAMAWLLAASGIIEGDPIPAFETYTRQCAITANVRDLSIMAATFANLGTNPVTGEEVFDTEVVQRVLSVMLTCGMYDDSGDWVSSVGLPAKSGVGGGILGVLPGQLGLASYSPPLDQHGSSVRGLAAYEQISRDLELHFVRTSKAGVSTIRSHFTLERMSSTVRRNDAAQAVLADHGGSVHIIEVMGDLLFSGAEVVTRAVSELTDPVIGVVIDLSRADDIAEVAITALSELATELGENHTALAIVDPDQRLGSLRVPVDMQVRIFSTKNAALSWAEDVVIAEYGGAECVPARSTRDFPLLENLSDEAVEHFIPELVEEQFQAGEVIRRIGQRFDGLWFITSGQVQTLAPEYEGSKQVLATLTSGMTFGESALDERTKQAATVKALTNVTTMHLSAEAIAKISRAHPEAVSEFWRAIAIEATVRLSRIVQEKR